jgi:hypothetical protein
MLNQIVGDRVPDVAQERTAGESGVRLAL